MSRPPRFRPPFNGGPERHNSGGPRYPQSNSMNGGSGDKNSHVEDEDNAKMGGKALFYQRSSQQYQPHQRNSNSNPHNSNNFKEPKDKSDIRGVPLYPIHPDSLKYYGTYNRQSSDSNSDHQGFRHHLNPTSNDHTSFRHRRSDLTPNNSNIMVPPTMPVDDIVSLLREFKPLECSCCDKLVGFQHRITGKIFCQPGCHGRSNLEESYANGSPMPSVSSPQQMPTSAEMHIKQAYSEPRYEQNGLTFERNGEMKVAVPPTARKDEDTSYRHTSTLHKTDAPPKRESRPAPTVDAVDNKVAPRPVVAPVRDSRPVEEKVPPKPVVMPVREAKAPAPARPDIEADETTSGMIPAAALRTDVNPFFKGFIPTKVAAAAVGPKPVKSYDHNEDDFPKAEIAAPKPIPAKVPPPPRVKTPQVEDVTEPEPKRAPAPVQRAPPPRLVANVPKGKYNWMDCVYSKHLLNGADAKVSFVWALNKYQIYAFEDENTVLEFQEKVQEYVASHKPITRTPVMDEMLLGLYQGDYYRGRVTEINDGKVKLVFVDFGDADYNSFEQLVEPDDELMKHPIYSVTIALCGVPVEMPKIKTPKQLNNHIFGPLRLELVEELKIRPNLEFQGKLWLSDEEHLNDMVLATINNPKYRGD